MRPRYGATTLGASSVQWIGHMQDTKSQPRSQEPLEAPCAELVIVTGRSRREAYDAVREAGFDGYPMLASVDPYVLGTVKLTFRPERPEDV
jgi:hypothetical protein